MQKKYSLIIVLFLFLSSVTLKAQETWSLEKCIKYAFDNNIQIKQQMLNVKVSEGKLFQSKMSALPNLNVSSSHAYSFGLATNYLTNQKEAQNTQATSFSINTSMTLFKGFQISNTKKQDKFDLLATISDVEKVKNNIALSIASAYLQILYSEDLVASADKQLELSKMQIERTSMLVKAGSLPEGNLLEIEAQAASDELQLVNAQNQLDIAYLTLTQFLDIKTTEGFKIQKPTLDATESKLVDLSPAGVFETSQQTMPQIISAGHRVTSAEFGVKIAKGGMSPHLSLNGNYNTGAQFYLTKVYKLNTTTGLLEVINEDPFMTQVKNNASKTISLGLSIPIFNGYQVHNNISNAKISLENARLNFDNEKNVLYKDIQQAYTDALAAQKKLKATQKSLVSLEEAFRYSEQKFNVGMVTSVDYTTAKTKLSKAETDLLQAKYELIFKSKILEFYKGVPLSL
ncbi:MAG: TolC family protein [Bacteroidales bacterium]|nr:TolC family protein [Bacteroidales bacterium]